MTDELRDYDRDVAQMRRDLYPRGAHTVPGADGEDMPATTGRRTARLTPPEEEFLMTWGWSVTSRYDGMHGADDWVDSVWHLGGKQVQKRRKPDTCWQ